MRKRLLVEEDIEDLTDFQKILLLNKGKLDPSEVEFTTSDGKRFDDIIEVNRSGLNFRFDDLEQFLKFFFPETFEEGSDGEWEVNYYDRMYYGYHDFYDDMYDIADEDWREGYVIQSIPNSLIPKLIEIIEKIDPKLTDKISKDGINPNSVELTDLLDGLGFEEDLTEVYLNAQVQAIVADIKPYFEKLYCNAPQVVGIDTLSCFFRYELRWGNAIMLISDEGTGDEKLLDLIFKGMEKRFSNHAPEWYEVRYNCFDRETYQYVSERGWDRVLDTLDERIEDGEYYSKEYVETLKKLLTVFEFNKWYTLPGSKTKILIDGVNPENNKIKYRISRNTWNAEYGEATLEELINMKNNYSLFDK